MKPAASARYRLAAPPARPTAAADPREARAARGGRAAPPAQPTAPRPRMDADGSPMRPFPARSLLGAGLGARLAVVAGALAVLWTTLLWALR